MDEHQHPLYFEARGLTDREQVKIWRYFQKRRDSGGGECAMIENIGGDIYKVCFKEKEAQERVLQRKFHTLSLPGGEHRLTVSRSSTLQTPDQPSASQSQVSRKASTKGLEKIFKLEVYLLYYLRDNPKASKLLDKQLSSIGCTVELDFDEEEAVVRGDVEKGPAGGFGGAAEKWEEQVDGVIISLTESYLCYHVFDPKQVKMLLQDRSFAIDYLKVYTERGFAVVVGDTEVVKEKIKDLEKSVPTRKELPVEEKLLKLVEEEFIRGTHTHYPEVKITRGSAVIILEGPDKEVQSGAAKLDELLKKIKEKRVELSSSVLTFIKTSGAISKYQARFRQSLRNPVSLEVGSDLVLCSLSSDALNEAEAAVLRDLHETTVPLQVASDQDKVKEILIKSKNEENQGELRVDLCFIQGPKVRLVGYTETVNKLVKVLQDYQMNQATTQEVINLPHPEMVDCFDQILSLIGKGNIKVTLKALHFPNPCVTMSGPRFLVQEAKEFLTSTLASVVLDTLVLDGPGAQQYFQKEGKVSKELVESSCQVLIKEKQDVQRAQSTSSPVSLTLRPSISRSRFNNVGNVAVNKASLKITLGGLEDEQVHVLVVPMVNKNMTSTEIGKSLLRKAGSTLTAKFESVAAKSILVPGDVLQVDGPPSLGCSKIFFIECLPWDTVRGKSVQALRCGLKRCLDLCVQLGFHSVAFPVIGPGIVLKFPPRDAIEVLTENIRLFGLSASTGSLGTIHVVIKPGYPDSEECYHEVYKHLSLKMNHGGQAIFRSLTSDLDDITMTMGMGVKLQVVFGDITNETTDVVVNTTDFINFDNDGVCKDILNIAGREVEAELKAAKVNRGEVFVSQSGQFPCKAIFHVCGEKDAGVIETLMVSIIDLCETYGFDSVAIPAICAGSGGLDPGVVAGAILRGIRTATPPFLVGGITDIRLILIKIDVFLAFKEEAMQVFPTAVTNTASAPQVYYEQPQPLTASMSLNLNILNTSSTRQQSVYTVIGLCREDIDKAMAKLKDLYQSQCSTHTFRKGELEVLIDEEMTELQQLVDTLDLCVEKDTSGNLTVNGLKDGVMHMRNAFQHSSLRSEMRCREEEDLYNRVSWCILGPTGQWERLPKAANHILEKQHTAREIVDRQGISWTVDLQRMQATSQVTATQLKRLEHLPDFTFPLNWDNMVAGGTLKLVALLHSSAEYRTVKEAFKRTVNKTVMKIERVQNIHLRRAYEVMKKQISDKNACGANEKFLYHGTTQENSDSIIQSGFNRSFAGQNATAYGYGTYFAVNANYSADPRYSRPASDGSQLMFMARVLTGIHTQGHSSMKVPPARNSQQPHDRYDSTVDRMDNPSMYIVFHDSQAYPEYLITFK
ncbi:protein mono-ADP-ribosyltransferase PARP14 [Parambassis ranga]|uniref:Poly [ADP-ribose] polymerase n=1 Tax=Parambassis ranga TaxID=210632 RepID=A0A6P7KDB5_9TELE|nr:protein mono-ADP-ribosyltransferase PARP14-like [Parambassis ranga]